MVEKYIVDPQKTVREVVTYMEKSKVKAVVITDADRRVAGLFSLGDMRHFFLKGGELKANICEAMNPDPKVFYSQEEVEAKREKTKLVIYPIVDKDNHLIDVISENMDEGERISDILQNVPLVIMAGGKGTRLYPYTKILPKALIPIGDYTITERIIKNFEKYGCNKVYMVLNHKANMIKAYYNEIDKSYEVTYVEEKKFLGTAGGLSLLKGKVKDTFFLSNCDILVNADLECIFKTHKSKHNIITFVCAMKDMMIPYGVVETDENGFITEIKEKPELSFLTNTGLYLIEPEVIDEIKEGEFIHLPDIAKKYIKKGAKVGVFPISEKSWLDMGQYSEMETMLKSLGV